MTVIRATLTAALTLVLPMVTSANPAYSQQGRSDFPEQVFWGDTHLHTNLSTDANAQGNKNIGPADTYALARGGTIRAHNGMQVKLHRPLDFLVIADHAENLGVANAVQRREPALLASRAGSRLVKLFDQLLAERPPAAEALRDFVYSLGTEDINDEQFQQTIWNEVTQTADQYTEPGEFTAFIGYEWTSRFENGTRHRVVIFKDGAEKTNKILPFSARDSANPEDLWRFLAHYEATTGGEVLAIAHNPNLSNGREFALTNISGEPFSLAHQQMRNRWEPLLEVTQIKGDSETLGILSPTDEFADHETWEGWSVIKGQGISAREAAPMDVDRTQYEYARSGLKLGLQQYADSGVNPFKFGMIGSTDAHTGIPAVEESNFWGKHAIVEPSSERLTHYRYRWRLSASGYAAVWATENTRQALFAAMKRKETYATTGPRMSVRFFGGWQFERDDAYRPNLAAIGYAKGVPMGGDLTIPAAHAPSFLIQALKDPHGAHLDRIQVVKGWRDERGKLHEKVYNVALSDNRVMNDDGKIEPVGTTVDVEQASYLNMIGDAELATVWRDPDFDASELAFYYVRVLEIPTPRWSAYDASFFNLQNLPDEIPMTLQERAYTSPIWYTPQH
ncbi:MAG: DUF3604 domain-containing protein [Pseudomonadales bacterium]